MIWATLFLMTMPASQGCWKALTHELLLVKMGGALQCSIGGPGVPSVGCAGDCFDWDNDGDVDLFDVALMLRRLGSNRYGYHHGFHS